MRIGLIIIGDEILSGKRVDQHFPKVVQLLAARGLQLSWAEFVGDDRERISATLKRTFASGDIVFSCGGIGATPDDHTRQAAAAALGLPLVLHQGGKDSIQQRVRQLAEEKARLPTSLRRKTCSACRWPNSRKARRLFQIRITTWLDSRTARITSYPASP